MGPAVISQHKYLTYEDQMMLVSIFISLYTWGVQKSEILEWVSGLEEVGLLSFERVMWPGNSKVKSNPWQTSVSKMGASSLQLHSIEFCQHLLSSEQNCNLTWKDNCSQHLDFILVTPWAKKPLEPCWTSALQKLWHKKWIWI